MGFLSQRQSWKDMGVLEIWEELEDIVCLMVNKLRQSLPTGRRLLAQTETNDDGH